MPKLKLQVAHQVSDRVRLKIPSAKGNPALSQEIGDAFWRIPGIGHITVNPVNGSVVLHYDPEFHDAVHSSLQRHTGRVWRNGQRPPDTEIDTLARKIEDEAEFLAQHSKSAKAVVDFCKSSTARSRSLLQIILAFGIIGFTLPELGASAETPVWVTLSLFAMNHFIEMHHPGQHGPQAACGHLGRWNSAIRPALAEH